MSRSWFTKVCIGIILYGTIAYTIQGFDGWARVGVGALAGGILGWTLIMIGKAVDVQNC